MPKVAFGETSLRSVAGGFKEDDLRVLAGVTDMPDLLREEDRPWEPVAT